MIIRTVQPHERRHILLKLYSEIRPQEDSRFGYSTMHRLVKELQEQLISEHGIDLGYEFKSENYFGPWDDQLQEDLELLDFSKLVNNHDEPSDPESHVKDHNLSPRSSGRHLAQMFDRFAGGKIQGKSRQQISKLIETIARK